MNKEDYDKLKETFDCIGLWIKDPQPSKEFTDSMLKKIKERVDELHIRQRKKERKNKLNKITKDYIEMPI